MTQIEIDPLSGFCFGVTASISKAEAELEGGGTLYCLGDIVHNSAEMERLRAKGLVSVTHSAMPSLGGCKLLLRAHGEPPSTYAAARRAGIDIVDATCPVVLKLQQRINHTYHTATPDTQIVIYGKAGHAEVNGLVGQTQGHAIVVDDADTLDAIDLTKPVALYSQTTRSLEGWHCMVSRIRAALKPGVEFTYVDTICRQVSGRAEHLRTFAGSHGCILFVSGSKSSNGKVLFRECRSVNPRTFMIAGPQEIDPAWLQGHTGSIGICGATSTPRWLMEQVRDRLSAILGQDTTPPGTTHD
ncbi:MAG: 4-hydroxy-3-methylbut-2-enyl diphosphate reductase [bacterium]|nr:4-hydroxy-3-methylbut-2-enyl diphosphate reductase [bacterium]